MSIANIIGNIQVALREGKFTSEAAVSQGIVLPILDKLGWPIFDTSIVTPEFSVEGRRVDFALCYPPNQPIVFIEVKKVGSSEGAERQLFEYAFHLGVPMAILTDGQDWSFYLPGEQGPYEERRVYKLDLLERDVAEAENRLTKYLAYKNVCSGSALQEARSDYQNVARSRLIETTLPKAWHALLKEPDSLLLELLADKVEDICGYRPSLDTCTQFLIDLYKDKSTSDVSRLARQSDFSGMDRTISTRTEEAFTFVFKGREYVARSAREVMTKIFQLLAKEDSTFLERFASRKHGKKRRYLARDKHELYPGRPDLCEEHAIEVVPGWWLGTNYSRHSIQEIIELALEVAGPQLRRMVKVKLL